MSHARSSVKLFRDPVYDLIDFDLDDPGEALLLRLIDTQEMQRLRRIRQLGMAYIAYPGAEHSRFGHSLGVAHMARRILDQLARSSSLDSGERFVCVCAALLHDIGHGPFSHIYEKCVGGSHEERSAEIILNEQSEVCQALADFDSGLPERVAAMLRGDESAGPCRAVISGQLDADRMDYLMRDSLMTGVKYGIYDLERLLRMMRFDARGGRIVLSDKGLMPVEKYLQSRYHMYRQVYFHKTVTAAESMLASLLRRAAALAVKGRLAGAEAPDSRLARMLLRPASLTLGEHLDLDDAEMLSRIKQWALDPDPILSDLSNRLLRRRIFKSIDVSHIPDPLDERLERGRAEAARAGLDPGHYFLIVESSDTPYCPYDPSQGRHGGVIYIEAPHGGYLDVEELSPTIKAFSHGAYTLTRVVFPETANGVNLRERMLAIFR